MSFYAQKHDVCPTCTCTVPLSQLGGDGWQPIETAPLDGTVILLSRRGMGVQPGYYAKKSYMPNVYHWAIMDRSVSKQGLPFRGAVELNAFHEGDPPTHWMPLPAPPAT